MRVLPDHTELAPGGADGPVLHHDVFVGFGLPELLVRVVVQGLLLVVLVQLLLCSTPMQKRGRGIKTCLRHKIKGADNAAGVV